MTATQMFRGLGYILTGNNSEKLIYWKDKCEDCERAKFIIFKKNYKKVLPVLSGKEGYSFSLSIEELKAISRQIEELGWYNDNVSNY